MTPHSVEIDVVNLFGGPSPVDDDALAKLVRYALLRSAAAGAWSIAVVLTSDQHLRELHRDFMGIDEETDVMTFPHDEDAEQGGDIVISIDRASEQARDAGHDLSDEIRFLTVHGVLHLCGWEDDTPDKRDRMHARQSEIIRDSGSLVSARLPH